MKSPLVRKLKGFQKAPRGRLLLLAERRLSQEEFVLYELGVALAVWDRNKEDYGTFRATNQELAEIIGWDSDTTAMRHKKSLIRKGIFIEVDSQRIKPAAFEKWQLRNSQTANKQEETADMQSSSANIEEPAVIMQENPLQDIDYPLGSYKGNLVSESLSDQEIEKILMETEDKG